jgi:hypothetical protein
MAWMREWRAYSMAFVEPFPDLLACELRDRIFIGASRSELMDMGRLGKDVDQSSD